MRGSLLAILVLAFPAGGQMRILATPEPMEVVRSVGVRGLGLWHLTVCNDSEAAVSLSQERLRLALPGIRIVASDRARAVLTYSRSRTRTAVAARVIQYLLMGAAPAAGFSGVPTPVVAGLALGIGVANQMAARLDSEVPPLAPLLSGLSDEALALGPGACGVRTVFAAPVHGARPVEARIGGPR
jgi:hypothetical protein